MEILAPAGSIAALKAAIKGGADAVYLGLGEHNARIKSADFSVENLPEWVDYAHLFAVKVYVTLNTAVKEEEISRFLFLAKKAAEAGADALIVSDLGMVRLLSAITDIPIHLSTQAGVQNSLDAKALAGLRIKRLILARETLPQDISEIKKYAEEIEVFAQGAICVSFSGGCLLGSKIYGASGNRGLCNQGCRLTYTALEESGKALKKGKLLSPRDLSLGVGVRKLADLGVTSIKIEGRLKSPAYVYAAVKYYREILSGGEGKESLHDLEESFNRGFTSGYTLKKSESIIDPKTSSHIGVPVGKVLRVLDRKGYKYAVVHSSYPFVKGDGAKILRKGEEVGGSDITSVQKIGEDYMIPVSEGVLAGDEVRLTRNHAKVEAAERIKNLLPIRMEMKGSVGEHLTLTARCGEISISSSSESTAEASHSSGNAAITEKLTRIGGTDFILESFSDRTDAPIYIPIAEVNELRRDVIKKLREALILEKMPSYRFDSTYKPQCRSAKKGKERIVEIGGAEDLLAAKGNRYVLTLDRQDRTEIAHILERTGKNCYLRLPKIAREKEVSLLRDLLQDFPSLGIYADNLYGVALARELKRGYIAGFGLNVFNEETAALFSDADFIAASVEYSECGDLLFRAGKLPLMSFAHCPFSIVYGKDCASCDRSSSILRYKNEEGTYLIKRREYISCDFTMYEDRVTRYPAALNGKSRFYSLIGLNAEEKRDMIKELSEEKGE